MEFVVLEEFVKLEFREELSVPVFVLESEAVSLLEVDLDTSTSEEALNFVLTDASTPGAFADIDPPTSDSILSFVSTLNSLARSLLTLPVVEDDLELLFPIPMDAVVPLDVVVFLLSVLVEVRFLVLEEVVASWVACSTVFPCEVA